ncbi:HDOD domain-containing protein [Noviherbaspirillum sp.]|uniref:HDOD domain-containing protein n=1 Tax=Noviherbaspirillum sp. TaxID=1926288 RepID=UPI002FE2AC37
MNSQIVEPVSAAKTMELLWSRVRQRGDLPGFSKVVGAIIGAMRGDDDREFNMTKTVLSDPALTQRVLRLANSAMYSVFGQGINTVSKAVIVLGTEAIGHLALGLKLIDGLSTASSDSADARKEMEKAVLAGHIARQLAATASTRDAEEAVVCSMLHSLGRMMVAFYLSDRWQQIRQRRMSAGISEEQASRDVLGMEVDEVGRLAAQHWGLPAGLISSLQSFPPRPVGEPLDHTDWLAAISTLSSRCATLLCDGDTDDAEQLIEFASSYAEMLGLEISQVLAAVEAAQKTAADEDSVVIRPLRRTAISDKSSAKPAAGKPADALITLARGVSDMRGAMRSLSIGQLMTMALETVHQGLGFNHTVAFLRNQEQAQYGARMGFGDGVQELLPKLAFEDAYQPDVFHAALANDRMIFVENAQAPAFVNKIPRWWKEALPAARSFVVLPLTVNRQPVGFLYGDWDLSASTAKIEPAEIIHLNELRAIIVLAIEQRRQAEPSWARRMQ